MNPILNPQITDNVGHYHRRYRLSQLGWNAMPTARNARGVAILVYRQDPSRIAGIQVKREDRVSFWLQPKDYEQDRFREAWDRVRNGGN